MDYYYEQNVENPNIDKHRKRTTALTIVRYTILAIGILFAYLLIFYFTPVNTGKGPIVFSLIFAALELVPIILAFIFIGKFLKKTNTEYDYILSGNVLRIVRIVRRTRRKLFATINIDAIESVGKIESEAYDRLASSRELKKQFAICDYDDESRLVYVHYHSADGNYLLHFEPNEEMVMTLRRSLPRFTIMDKSMNGPVGPTQKA